MSENDKVHLDLRTSYQLLPNDNKNDVKCFKHNTSHFDLIFDAFIKISGSHNFFFFKLNQGYEVILYSDHLTMN